MNQESLKLTAYFGERQRNGRQFAADALLDLYGRHELATSILLRGAEGFGLKHHLRTDLSLTLSEDLPLVAIAIDTPQRVHAALEEAAETFSSGLITLERARMLTGDITAAGVPQQLHDATKLTIYLGRQERVGRTPAYIAICDLLYRRGIAGATVLLGVDGTAQRERERAEFFGRNQRVPMILIAVGSAERIAQVLPELGALPHRPLMTLERTRVCKRDGQLLAAPDPLPTADEHGMGLWQKLMVYTSEAAKHDGQPVHRAITRRLRQSGASGSTTLRGLWGFHGDHPPHGDKLLQLRRHVPVVTTVIDTPDRIADSFEIIDELTRERGLVTSELIPALHATSGTQHRGGLQLASPRP